MSSTAIVNIDSRRAMRSSLSPTLDARPITVHSCLIEPLQAAAVAEKLGLTPQFISTLAPDTPSSWRSIKSLQLTVSVTNRSPSPAGVSDVRLNPVRYTTLRLPYAGAPHEYVYLLRVLFSTYSSPQRTATLRKVDGGWQSTLRGISKHGITLHGTGAASQSHMLLLAFTPQFQFMSDASLACWTDGTTSPRIWAALTALPALHDALYASQANAWLDIKSNAQAPTSTSPHSVPAKTLDQLTVLQWFAGLPLTEAYEFLQNASAVYTQRINNQLQT